MEGTATRTESLLRPREIQVRIRSGQSAETVAAAAQTTVERVMAYATPVLAERAFVAQQAAKASVRRRVGDGPVGRLGDAVAGRLEGAGIDPASTDWDAWRREDGRWTVVAQYAEAGESRRAEFTYDAMGRYVVAEDDTARWLVGERRAAEPSATPAAPSPHAAPSVHAAGPAPDGEQLALGDDALRVVTGQPLPRVEVPAAGPTPGPAAGPSSRVEPLAAVEQPTTPDEPTEDLTETARAVRAVADPPPDAPVLFEDAELRPGNDAPARRPSHAGTRPRARRSMPSWDDIMLGSAPRGD
jgi:hypothetical protein